MSYPAPLPAPLYQGSVNQWECDDGGHLNIRFHFERAFVGLAHMARALELPRAFKEGAGSTLLAQEVHTRFIKEARPGAPLTMHGGVVDISENEATLCFDMRHHDGAPGTAFTFKVRHVETRGLRSFPWSDRTKAAAKRLKCKLPDHAKPRSINVETSAPADASLAERSRTRRQSASAAPSSIPISATRSGGCAASTSPGRISDSVRRTCSRPGAKPPPAMACSPPAPSSKRASSSASFRALASLVESALRHRSRVGDKTLRIVHWIIDPETGAAWASMEAVALTFDVNTRKALTPNARSARARRKTRSWRRA
jgi:acyl-CoA thioester hydrolase